MESKNINSILIVDDSSTNLVLLEAILQEEGYKTYTALNAKEAYASIDKFKPDLILLDLLMPQVSGFDILERLKAFPDTSEIPVIVVSAKRILIYAKTWGLLIFSLNQLIFLFFFLG